LVSVVVLRVDIAVLFALPLLEHVGVARWVLVRRLRRMLVRRPLVLHP
jgi:hypothetical protein